MSVRQLSGLDAEFLAMESDVVRGHFGTVLLFDTTNGPAPTLEALRDRVAERLHRLPVLRQRVMQVPFGLDQPYWVDDTGFDLRRHVLQAELPEPEPGAHGAGGGLPRLAAAVADLHALPLDRDRPLWQLWFWPQAAPGRAALYVKVHHAMTDGVGGFAVIAAVLDDRRVGEPPPPWCPEPEPGPFELLGRRAMSMPRNGIRAMLVGMELFARAPAVADGVLRRLPSITARADRGPTGRLPLRAPSTPFNAAIGAGRDCAFADLPLPVVKDVARRTGASVNDVVMAVCAAALRHWLTEHGALPEEPLIAAVPVSTRLDVHQALGNQLAMIRGPLPTDVADPVARLAAVTAGMAATRSRLGRPTQLLADAAEYAPPLVADVGWWASAQLMRRVNAWNVMVANVRGPGEPRYLLGAKVIASYPVSVLVHGQGLNISVISLGPVMCCGLVADPDLVADLDRLAARLGVELALLAAAVGVEQPVSNGT